MAQDGDYGSWETERVARYTTHSELAHKCMLLFSLNTRSLRNKKDKLEELFRRIGEPYVICFQEIWHGDFTLPNYYPMIKCQRKNKEGGGVGMLVHQTCKFKLLNSPFIEGLFETQAVELAIGKEKIRIYNIYNTPTCKKNQFLDFVKLLKIDQSFKNNIVVGDMNLDLDNPENSDISSKFAVQGMATLVDIPTRVSSGSSSVIDHLYTSIPRAECRILQHDISDHFGVALIKESIKKNKTNTNVSANSVPRQDSRSLTYFKDFLKCINWASVINNKTTESFAIFERILKEAVTLCCEPRPVNKKMIPKQPWFSKGMGISRYNKEKMLREAIKSKDTEKWQIYKIYRNHYNRILRRAKIFYYQKEFDKAHGNGKQTWSLANELTGRAKNKVEIGEIEGCKSEKEKCSAFNKYYLNVAQELAQKLPKTDKSFMDYLPKRKVPSGDFKFRHVSPQDVCDIISDLTSKTSCSHDLISNKMLKCVADQIKFPLAHLINLSMELSFIPTSWKLGKVTPIFKHTDPTAIGFYRPISILSSLGKCLEAAVYKQIIEYLEYNELLFPDQYGFRKKHSTEQLLLKLHKAIFGAKNNGKWSLVIYLDLAKAFDCVNLQILLKKVDHYGLPVEWFRNYLEQRAQYVQINNNKSEIGEVTTGVHQGTILASVLYLLYCNDLPYNTILKAYLFADDTSLFYEADNQKDLFDIANKELAKLENWFSANKLTINASKTRYQIFSSTGKVEQMNLTLMGNNIERCWEEGKEHYFKLV